MALAGNKQRALLALLLVHANETLPVERLIDELWGEHPPTTAAKTLQVHVSRLRKALDAGAGNGAGAAIVTREHGYQLRLDPDRLDAHHFERLVAEGRRELAAGDPKRAAAAFEAALSLWRGAPLAGLGQEAFVAREAARLEDLRLAALEDLNEAKLALGHHSELVGELEALIGEHPYRERLRAQLMLALYRCERQADALQAYQDARRTLVEELGIEPGERLRELERAVLAQDPALAAPAARPGVGAGGRDGGDLPTGVVTFLLTDIEGSSRLWEADADAMAAALELHDELIAKSANEHGGRLLKAKGEGDATLTVFRRASDAVACAVVLQRTLQGAPWPGGLDLRVRVALHTGEAHERDGDYFGPALNRAARLRSVARGGATVMSQATAEIVHDRLPPETELVELGRQELRGLSRPENVFELRASPRPVWLASRRSTRHAPWSLACPRRCHAPSVARRTAPPSRCCCVATRPVWSRLLGRAGWGRRGWRSRWRGCLRASIGMAPGSFRSPRPRVPSMLRARSHKSWASHHSRGRPSSVRSSVSSPRSTGCWCSTTSSTCWRRHR